METRQLQGRRDEGARRRQWQATEARWTLRCVCIFWASFFPVWFVVLRLTKDRGDWYILFFVTWRAAQCQESHSRVSAHCQALLLHPFRIYIPTYLPTHLPTHQLTHLTTRMHARMQRTNARTHAHTQRRSCQSISISPRWKTGWVSDKRSKVTGAMCYARSRLSIYTSIYMNCVCFCGRIIYMSIYSYSSSVSSKL